MTCWIEKSSVRQGPLSEDQVAQRVRLGLLGSLDRISVDGESWTYLRDTAFWNPTRTLSEVSAPQQPQVAAAPVRSAPTPVPQPRVTCVSRDVLEKFIKPGWMEV